VEDKKQNLYSTLLNDFTEQEQNLILKEIRELIVRTRQDRINTLKKQILELENLNEKI
jgi:hypothetical protein